MSITVETPLMLGSIHLKNRIAKGPLNECLADADCRVTPGLLNFYEAWGKGGLSLCITGNVMVDKRALSDAGNVAVEDESDMQGLQKWANIGKRYGMVQIVQISHPGKQSPKTLHAETVAPSAIGFGKAMSIAFAVPRALTEAEILDLIRRFGETARICKKAGFQGVQMHGAHGYLISQFLSPLHNQRTDQWGGSLDNRMRFVLECYKSIRAQVGNDFVVGVKLNSADFQKGGFGEEESALVMQALDAVGIDFIEISGGTYEAPAMTGVNDRATAIPKKDSTVKREAYFLEFAERVRQEVKAVLMVSGGFRTRAGMDAALASGACDLVGVARPLIIEPNAPTNIIAGKDVRYAREHIKSGIKVLDSMAATEMLWYTAQMKLISKRKKPQPNLSPTKVLLKYMLANVNMVLRGSLRTRA